MRGKSLAFTELRMKDMRVIEWLAAQTGYSRNSTKRNIIGGAFNLPQAGWNRSAEGTNGNQAIIGMGKRTHRGGR